MRRAILNGDNGELKGALERLSQMAVSKVRTKDSEISGVTWLVKCHELSPIKRVCVRVICSCLAHAHLVH